jgi:hypothetical protein
VGQQVAILDEGVDTIDEVHAVNLLCARGPPKNGMSVAASQSRDHAT